MITCTILALVGAIALIWGWRIRDVLVTGATVVPNAAVRDAVLSELSGVQWRVFPRTSILLLQKRRLEASITGRFSFADADVRRRVNGLLEMTVMEQPIVAIVAFEEGVPMLLSRSGSIVGPAPESLDKAVELMELRWLGLSLATGEQMLSGTTIELLSAVWGTLVQAGGSFQPQFISQRAGSEAAFDVRTVDGAVVTVTADAATDRQLTKLRVTLRERASTATQGKLRIIDLRYGDRVYVQ